MGHYIWIFFLILPRLVYGTPKTDSLKAFDDKSPKQKAELFCNIADSYKDSGQYKKALSYYQESLDLYRNTHDKAKTGLLLNNIGIIHRRMGEYGKSVDFYKQALKLRKMVGDKKETAKTLNNLGIVYHSIKDYNLAIEHYLQALAIKREIGDDKGTAKTLNNIGILFYKLSEYPKSLKYFEEALVIKTKHRDQLSIARTLNNIGIVYENTDQLDKALVYFNKALKLKEKLKNEHELSTTLNNIGNVYFSLKDYPKAIAYYNKVIAIKSSSNFSGGLPRVYNNIGDAYRAMKEYKKSEQSLKLSRQLLTERPDFTALADNYMYSSQLYADQKQHDMAYQYIKSFTEICDSLKKEEKNDAVIIAEARYNFLTREHEIKLKEARKNQNIKTTAISFLIFFSCIILILYSKYKLKLKANHELTVQKHKAEESDRLKSAFLANMSHEIRTPMNAILGFTDLLKDPNITPEELKNYVNIIEDGGQRMLFIINDLIDISKIESGQIQINNSNTDINKEIDNIYNLLKREAQKNNIDLIVDKAKPGAPMIASADKEKIQAILTNLVKNAIKFTPSGFISIGYKLMQGHIEFFVKDTGLGISEEKIGLIFERFVQGKKHDNVEGTGLGLAISKAYVEMMGGKIWVHSEPNKGSTFYFTIPLKNNEV